LKRQPRKTRKTEGRGNHRLAKETSQVSIRMAPTLEAFLERWGKAQSPTMKPASVARLSIETFQAITEQLGHDYLEIVRRASAMGQSPGQYIGAQIKANLEAERKQRK
jgi:hypothetical protein